MRPKYVILDVTWDEPELKSLIKQKIVSSARYKYHTILGRYGTNKTTLMKILKNEVLKSHKPLVWWGTSRKGATH